jgi:5-oxoprolinase (ATP-hydrolysing)
LTDIHLLLGRIDPEGFSIPIRLEDARNRLNEIMKQSGESDWRALAEGFLTIATERMTHAIRQVTFRDGEDPSGYGLVAFGGAGGLHACRVAGQLGIKRIIFPSDAGILSAKGIHYAPRESVKDLQYFSKDINNASKLDEAFEELVAMAREDLLADGVDPSQMADPLCSVYLRITGQEAGMSVEWHHGKSLLDGFKEKFVSTFGYFPKSPVLEIIKLRAHLTEEIEAMPEEAFDHEPVPGPHVIRDPFGTFFVEKGWSAMRGDGGGFEILRSGSVESESGKTLGKVQKTLVMNRLEGLVEEMGDQLQRTALSTNIRERLDFSCALLDASGRLLVNAPHIPVHLGAMGLCLRECAKRLAIGPGDVIMTNHPGYGGSHLPDVTLIRGLFDNEGRLVGYLANRAHHAEWGGKSPGSMPADAVSLAEEGVVFKPRYLIRNGTDCFADIEDALTTAPYPTRAVHENRIDLEAQLASLQRGVQLFDGLIGEYRTQTVQSYFHDFYQEASDSLSTVLDSDQFTDGQAEEMLDDGYVIKVTVSKNQEGLTVDFTGTSPLHEGNLNATPAIVQSAVLYVLRLLVDKPMPLNEGLLENVQIRLPDCFLNPTFTDDPGSCPAVVGGNVETSQRVVDVLIRAFRLMAAGQGTMNNFLFGNQRFGYYETIGGGSGAGESFDGASGVHVHMTNTAITDPEILEQRFPVRCREFSLRKDSGGAGLQMGGDGLVREVEFLEPVTVSLLTQNRHKGARGAAGGMDGKPGSQWVLRSNQDPEPINGIAQVEIQAGEAIRIETPGIRIIPLTGPLPP